MSTPPNAAPPIREPWKIDQTGRLVSVPWILWLQQITVIGAIPAHVAEADPHEQYALETAFDDHSARHENGGADEINVDGLSGLLANPQMPVAHNTSHQDVGDDEINVSGLSGELADDQPPKSHDNTKHSTAYQAASEKDAANGYAGLNASSRTTKGIITTDDLIVDLATKGHVFKSPNGHYWRTTMSDAGAIVITDLGTSAP